MRKVVAAGSILVDKINEIGAYPKAGELTQIRARSRVPGGLVPNTGCDIHILDERIPVSAFGAVGDDDDGRFAVAELKRRGLDTAGVVVKPTATSFTDVMSVPGGERTFFTYPGASAEWGCDDFPFEKIEAGDLVLLGYFLLLAKVDAGDGLRILKKLKRIGAETAIDLVSENSNRYALVRICLPYVDNLIVNEIEAARLAGIEGDLKQVAARLFELGVQKRVVIHMPQKGVSLLKDGTWTEVESIALPEGFIKGKTGAGDAFCAGCLVGIFNGLAEKEILELGGIAAVGAMSALGAVEGMRPIAELKNLVSTLQLQL
ncbi:MAG: carbohydrate kinase family protein [Kiritimatiellae bacterium]|nr:carbohydrate kinase family protein [Kiritimatiellia bacterium]